MTEQDEILTARKTCELLGCSRSTLEKYIKVYKLPRIQIMWKGKTFFKKSEIIKWQVRFNSPHSKMLRKLKRISGPWSE
jgi:predicted DNA-binding transcriptional regulator AlpA